MLEGGVPESELCDAFCAFLSPLQQEEAMGGGRSAVVLALGAEGWCEAQEALCA